MSSTVGRSKLWDAKRNGTLRHSCLIVATHEAPSTAREATGVTFQHPENCAKWHSNFRRTSPDCAHEKCTPTSVEHHQMHTP